MSTTGQRRQHRLKHNAGTEGPSNFLFFDCETLPYAATNQTGFLRHRLRLGVAIAGRYEGGQLVRRRVGRFHTSAQFFSLLSDRLRPKCPLWVFAHNLPFDFRLVGGFKAIAANCPEQWRVVLADPPTIIQGTINGCPVKFVDSMNYVRTSMASIGQSVGLPKLPMPAFTAPDEDWFIYCQRDVEILEKYILRLRNYLQENDCGTFGKTAAQCAMNLYRHRLMAEPIVLPANDDESKLARAGYYGGQLECFQLGPIAGPIWHLDVNSLYPSVMATERFPKRLIGVYSHVSNEWLACRIPEYGAIAECLCVSTHRTFPKRFDGHTHYVSGIYRTTLAGPELASALSAGHVVYLGAVALYELGDLFSRFVSDLWSERMRAKAAGDKAWELCVKMLLNSLSGKWAQRSPRYHHRLGLVPPRVWGPFYRWGEPETPLKEFRAIAGVSQELIRHDENWQSFPAISAFITAAGREVMRSFRAVAGEGGVFYQDTDSLMVDDEAFDRLYLAGCIHPSELGKLKVVGRYERGHIYGPKDYQLDDTIVRGSVAAAAVKIGKDTYEQWDFTNAEKMLKYDALAEVEQVREVRRLTGQYRKGRVTANGRTRPFEVYAF